MNEGTYHNGKFHRFDHNKDWNNCDRCGRFTSQYAEGASTYFVPDSDLTHEDFGLRCPDCTKKYGKIPPSQGCIQKYCSSTNKI